VAIDADLQDPPELIELFYGKLMTGVEVVYAKRHSLDGETLVKRIVAYVGYSVINRLRDVEIPRTTGDFRVMSRRVMEELRRLNGSHGFLRGLVAYVGFRQTWIEYDREERFSGKGNYNRFVGSLKMGLNVLISFSSRPLQLMSLCGFVVSFFSFLLGVWYVVQKLIGVALAPGLSATVLAVTSFAGVPLFSWGVMGEYVGRIYDEVKQRPLFIADRKVNM
jgi:polyisoprenyl-phosphate glycosyltransferase